MNRRLILPIMLIVLIVSAITPFIFTVQASAGCSAVGGLSGFYVETQSRSSGSLAFSAGDTIKVAVTGPGNSGATTIRLAVSGPAGFDQTSASSLSFTIPSDGNYDVTVGNASMEDLNSVTVSCVTSSGGGGVAGPPWSGYSDGRLSPDMAENFSLWCLRNNLDVYRAPNGKGEFIVSIPLAQIIAIKPEKVMTIKTKFGPLFIRRDKNNVFYVEGTIGTNAPAFASKYFLMEACFKANGAEVKPPSNPIPVKPTVIPSVTPNPTATPKPTLTPSPIPTITPVVAVTLTPGSSNGSQGNNLVTLLVDLGPLDPSKDRDGDGVRNTLDLCPDDPNPGLAFGCPDTDGDTLSDPVDACPNEFGIVGMRGCADTDGDGVSSLNDLCPNYAPPAGSTSAYGCPDADGDGYPNIADWCPFRSNTAGVVLFMGCPDPDGDGFLSREFPLVPAEYYDDCPRYPYPWDDANGTCPDTTILAPVIPAAPSQIFAYAAQTGAYDGLVLQTDDEAAACISGKYGFCGLFD
ncbi:MAG: thrombospondin type 3 repeat-containing protein [Chloroflexi bacterium]|nr:thrombospondin type 3 repeat-containing protein [Chloroflexota bacterium]MCC6895389.1 thrombospondin type 3 repeat-containing protein [Anaerolineae bacterium]